jgi:hypothetical protein
MHKRISVIRHQAKQILFVDCSACSAAEVEKIARLVPEIVTAQPRASVLALVDFTGAKFDEATIRTMKESAVFDKPYIKASAWIGSEALPKMYYEQLTSFSGRDFPAFNTRLEALEWLVKK